MAKKIKEVKVPEPTRFRFREGDTVSTTITGRVYSVNEENGKIFYGILWENVRGNPVQTLHEDYTIVG